MAADRDKTQTVLLSNDKKLTVVIVIIPAQS